MTKRLEKRSVLLLERMPPGVLDAWMWGRERKDGEGNRRGIKKSLRWTEGYEQIAEYAA